MKLKELVEAVDVTSLDIDTIKPDKKDVERADGLNFQGKTFKGNNEPFAGEASKMAKLIKDPTKLVRRSKAVVAMYGTEKYDPYGGRAGHFTGSQRKEVWAPFADALENMGFTRDQIKKIEAYRD
jgi:hypothetical protein